MVRKGTRTQFVLINVAVLLGDLRTFLAPHPPAPVYGLAVVSATCSLLALALLRQRRRKNRP